MSSERLNHASKKFKNRLLLIFITHECITIEENHLNLYQKIHRSDLS